MVAPAAPIPVTVERVGDLSPDQLPRGVLTADQHIDLFDRIFLWLIWIEEGSCIISNRDTGMIEPMQLRELQRSVIKEMLRQAATCPRCLKTCYGYQKWECPRCSKPSKPVYRGVPVRILVPKARKMGISTLIQSFGVFCVEHYSNVNALTVAHTDEDTGHIFDIALRIHQQGQENPGKRPSFIGEPHGSAYRCRTARGLHIGSGGTVSILHLSEVAKWTGKRGQGEIDKETLTSVINSVPFAPHTVIFLESTGMGPSGEFYRRCKKVYEADNLNDRAIKYDDDEEREELGFRLLFFPWWQDEDYARPPPEFWQPSAGDLEIRSQVEKECGVILTNDQLYWRRWKMTTDDQAEEGSTDELTFTREFPNTFWDCFLGMEGRVYPRFTTTQRHCRKLDMRPWYDAMNDPRYDDNEIGLMRTMDVGFAGSHMWVILWIAYNQKEPPELVINPDDKGCRRLIDELLLYANDDKTGKPKKENDHGPDALRIGVASRRLRGLVYVYRALYYERAFEIANAQQQVARDIHEASGWEIPHNADANDLSLFQPGTIGEYYVDNICDRSARGTINLFRGWSLPFRGHPLPEKHLQVKSEIEWGVQQVNALIDSDAWIQKPEEDQHAKLVKEAIDRIQGHTPMGRPMPLTDAHKAALDEEARRNPAFNWDPKVKPFANPKRGRRGRRR